MLRDFKTVQKLKILAILVLSGIHYFKSGIPIYSQPIDFTSNEFTSKKEKSEMKKHYTI